MTNKFQGYKTEDDSKFEASSIEDYYTAILKGALRTFQSKEDDISVTKTDGSDFEEELKKYWNKTSIDNHLLGYISKNEPGLGTLKAILLKIAEEEKKYYYKWEESGSPVQKENGEEILTQLQRVTIVNYYRIFFSAILDKPEDSRQHETKFTLQLRYQSIDGGVGKLPIAISDSPIFSKAKASEKYYGVYFNTDAIPLYLDQGEETTAYRYEKKVKVDEKKVKVDEKKGSAYSPVITSKIATPFDSSKMTFIKITKDDQVWLEYVPEYRFYLSLFNNRNNQKYLSSVVQQINAITNEDNYKNALNKRLNNFDDAEAVAKNCGIEKNDDSWKKALAVANACGITKDDKFWKKALNASCLIFNDYYCFYYKESDALKSFLSSVNIGGGGSGGGNYAMRADKVSEVEYLWKYQEGLTKDELALAKLLRAYMNLSQDKQTTTRPTDGFFPTNWPCDTDTTTSALFDKVSGMSSWFEYYKKFKTGATVTRRNNPQKPDKPTRTAAFSDKTFKLDNTSYRVWKKGQEKGGYKGEAYGGGSAQTRLDAATVMADALSKFSIYQEMMKKGEKKEVGGVSIAKITDTKLPASAFAYYLIKNDDQVKEQWETDNPSSSSKYENSLPTNQEWCHLLGHGDGGTEELGNFVSGSKHCNTEQLAIEIGQRRITHNEDIPKEKRDKLKAKITAYLMPNEGAWAVGKEADKKDLEKYKALTKADTTWINAFFEHDADKYKLKKIGDVKKAFDELSDAIRNATSGFDTSPGTSGTDDIKETLEKKKKLFEFRRYLESNFFLYLPLARWMRYKIYYGKNKIFDHIYDAQSQSFNYHEAQILDFTVERVIYYAMGLQDEYKQNIAERVDGLITKEDPENIEKVIESENTVGRELKSLDSNMDVEMKDEEEFSAFKKNANNQLAKVEEAYNTQIEKLQSEKFPLTSRKRKKTEIESNQTETTKLREELNVITFSGWGSQKPAIKRKIPTGGFSEEEIHQLKKIKSLKEAYRKVSS